MGVGPFSTESSASQKTTTLSDQAQYNQKSVVAQSGSLLVNGKGAKFLTPGATDYSGLRLDKGSTLTINQSDPAALNDAFSTFSSQFAGSLKDLLAGQNTSTASSAAEANATLEKVLGTLTPLAESKQTDGQSGQNKTVLYIVVAIAIAIAAVFIFRRKK